MSRTLNGQWSLQSMFGFVSACAVMAAWLRLRIGIDAEGLPWWWISIPGILALGTFAFWLLQCWSNPKFGTPRGEFLAAALLLSAVDTTWAILSGLMALTRGPGPRLQDDIQLVTNSSAILGYGFMLSCSLAAMVAIPQARASVKHFWLFVLVAVVTVNVGLIVLLCNWFGKWLGVAPR